MKLTLRYMTLPDIPEVTRIDRLSFQLSWSDRTYTYEITDSPNTHMAVLELDAPPAQAPSMWRRLLSRMHGHGASAPPGRIAGYGGMWIIQREAHISTIAVHPAYRGKGFGEALLAGMVHKAVNLDTDYIGLEVRVSNQRAINLYRKYEFQVVGVKTRYYRDNDEDAYEMQINFRASGFAERFRQRLNALAARCQIIDSYTWMAAPRKPRSAHLPDFDL